MRRASTAPGEPEQTTLPDCDTLIQYMGGKEAIVTARKLLAQGRSPELPVIVVENCSRTDERVLRLKLSELENGLAACSGPVLVMFGEAFAARN